MSRQNLQAELVENEKDVLLLLDDVAQIVGILLIIVDIVAFLVAFALPQFSTTTPSPWLVTRRWFSLRITVIVRIFRVLIAVDLSSVIF